ncbi:MAG: MerR family DNA-binding transcriptional regulator [Chloroflexi bacterium]|nr:MerR family DNA-binding transcriptional regulator [Chloroflexota bacterium]
MATFQGQRRPEPEWLGLGEASRYLGVNESTLRRWADAGLVQTFRTPGGHRRFAAAGLRRIIDAAGEDLAAGADFDGDAVDRIRARLREADAAQRGWLDGISDTGRSQLAQLGRQTVALVERYLSGDAGRDALEEQGGALGRRYAVVLQGEGVRLTDAVSAFAYFRRGMDEAVRAYGVNRGLSPDATAGLWERVAVLEDQLLVGLTSAYESDSGGEA